MVTLFVVKAVTSPGHGLTDEIWGDRISHMAVRVLGHYGANLQQRLTTSLLRSSPAPQGAVRSLDDAKRLLRALEEAYPGVRFIIEKQQLTDVCAVKWVTGRGSVPESAQSG
jgi:hypothetical protein